MFLKRIFLTLLISLGTLWASYLPGESSFPSLSWEHGAFGNPAGVTALGTPGLFTEFGKENGEYLFKTGGNLGNFGAGFYYLTDNNGKDESYWNIAHAFSLFENILFVGNRIEAFRSAEFSGTEWSYSPGIILRPFSFLSLGYVSKNLVSFGPESRNRLQEWGATLRYKDYSLSAAFDDLDKFRLLATMDFFGFLAGVEIPIIGGGDYRLTLSHALGSSLDAAVRFSSKDYLPHQFRLAYHQARNTKSSQVSIVQVPLNSEIKENSKSGIPFLFPANLEIHTVRNHIEHLLEMPGNTIIIFNFSGYAGGFAISKEIQRSIRRLQQAGKFVVAFLDDVRPSTWIAAATANYIVAEPSARVSFKGFGGSTLYYKGFLDKLGIRVEFLRHGKYKSAVEAYVSDSMSAEAKENLTELYQKRWDFFKSERKNLAAKLDSFASVPQITAASAFSAGLLDTVLYEEQVPQYAVKKIFGIDAPFASAPTFSITDKMIFENTWGHRPEFALITIEGTITEKMVREIQNKIKSLPGSSYRALILRINSPGGSAKASDELYASIREVSRRGVPVVASIGDYGASGGFYIACAADRIVAEEFSLVGSIGIYGGKIDASILLNKLGIRSEIVKSHPHADAESFTRPLDSLEESALQAFMDDFYNRFLNVVSKATSVPTKIIDEKYGEGRVFVGEEAKSAGLVSDLGGLDKAIEVAKELSGVSKNKTVHLKSLLNKKTFISKESNYTLSEAFAEYGKLQAWALEPLLLNEMMGL